MFWLIIVWILMMKDECAIFEFIKPKQGPFEAFPFYSENPNVAVESSI